MIGTFYSDIEDSIPSTIENIPHNAGSTVVTGDVARNDTRAEP